MQFYLIATDGGLLDAPYLTTRTRLSPGERAEIVLNLTGMNGQSVNLMCYGSELPMGIQGGPTMPMPPGSPNMNSPLNCVDYNIMQINVVAQTVNPVSTIPATLTTNTPYSELQSNATRTIRFTADSAMVMDGPFYFNDSSYNMMRIDYTIPLNNIEVWKLVNLTMVAHPFHIHDEQFYILDRNGIAPGPEEMGRKDVVLVPPGDSVRFIIKFNNFSDTIIPYMYHCHILMHEDDGMMGQFVVSPGATGINETIRQNSFSLYPNPASDLLNLQFTFSTSTNTIISVKNILGQKIFSQQIPPLRNTFQLNISEWKNGIYIIQIKSDSQTYTHRFIKQ